MINKDKNKLRWIKLYVILAFILFLFVGFLRVTNFRGERMDLLFLLYFILAILFIRLFFYLDKELKRKYYTEKFYSSRLIAGGYTFVTLFSPEGCFKKQHFWKGYFIYLISRISLIAFIYLIIKLLLKLFL